jgi:lysine decarboxylase/arginine decarboxylase
MSRERNTEASTEEGYQIVLLPVGDPPREVRATLEAIRRELVDAGAPADVLGADDTRDRLSDPTPSLLGALLIALGQPDAAAETLTELLALRDRHWPELPTYLLAERRLVADLPEAWLDAVDGVLSAGAEVPGAVRDRLLTAVAEYRAQSVPPFFRALRDYTEHGRFAWHTPGHLAGEALLKHPAGRALHAFYGPNLFRADICSSVPEVGSVLEHEGALLDAEREAAQIFHADRSYFVTNGTTGSNHIVLRSLVKRGDAVLVDRNCHKSILNALIMTGGIPVFMRPNRNGQGLIGPVQARELEPETIRARIQAHPLLADDARPVAAVLTNSTYDGTLYRIGRAIARLGASTDAVVADEAWISYAPFHPLLAVGSAMRATAGQNGPTVFSTTSLHKTLTALSQGSLINIREGRRPVPHDRFNEAFLLHTSTSPQYSLLASLDVAVRMMAGAAGEELVDQAVREAVEFRRAVTRLAGERSAAGTWSFTVWQPDTLPGDDDEERTARDPDVWAMAPDAPWHGFRDIPDADYALLDPTKVTVLTPGVDAAGRSAPFGIPAPLVARYLREHGVVAEKTGFYSLLFLFTLAVNPGQSDSLLAALNHFRRDYEANRLVEDVLPDLFAEFPARYRDVRLQDLAQAMHRQLTAAHMAARLEQIYADLPEPALTPTEAFERLMDGAVDLVALEHLEPRTAAVLSVVYPPGIPVIVPGERFGNPSGRAVIAYLREFERWEQAFPGFENEVQGVVRSGAGSRMRYHLYCVR